MTHDPGSPHARLRENADQAWRLYCALETLIPYRESTSSGQERIGRTKPASAPVPWNTVAAELTLEFHNEIRRLETHLKERVIGGYPKRRGSSGPNTRLAIESVVNLCTTCETGIILGILNYLATWTRRADAYFNPQNGLYRLPRAPGQGEARCPYCQRPTMRWNPSRGWAICVNPACHNDYGLRPRWSADFTLDDSQLVFRWEERETA